MRIAAIGVTAFWAAGVAILASDWPQFLGPTRNAIYAGNDLADNWPKDGPPVTWKRKVGQGFSGPVVSGAKLILFHRLGDKEMVQCLEADKGKGIWKFEYPTGYRDAIVGEDHGPRATPAIEGGKVFTLGAEGLLHCLDLASGKADWRLDARRELRAEEGFFGFGCSPLVEGEAVLLNIGGRPGAGIVGINKHTGKLLWKATEDEAGYSSPVLAQINQQRLAVFFTRAGLVGLNPLNGAIHFRLAWRSPMHASVNAATPVIVGNLIFISASYNTGAALLRVQGGKLEKVWSGDESLSNHFATSVHHQGFLYGFDGRQEYGPRLRCVELITGKVQWTKEGQGAGALLLANDRLLALFESGLLLQIAAQTNHYQELGRAQLLGSGTRAEPALANGFFYARSRNQLICADLRKAP